MFYGGNQDINTPESDDNSFDLNQGESRIRKLLQDLPEINIETGLKNTLGDPEHFIEVLKITLKDMESAVAHIIKKYDDASKNEIRTGIHNLKSLLANIGADGLSEEAISMEALLTTENHKKINQQLYEFTQTMESFLVRLKKIVEVYDKLKTDDYVSGMSGRDMTEKEYEQCILNTIYYIKRFEYDSIVKELEKLLQVKDVALRKEFIRAMEEIKEFNYNSALMRITNIAEKMGK